MTKKFLFLIAATICMAACGTKPAEPATEGEATEVAETEVTEPASGEIVYVHVDAVLAQCDLFKTEGVALQEKTEKAQKSLAQREQKITAEANQLQEQYQKGLITTANAQAKQQEIEKRAKNFQASAQKELQALEEENYVFNNRATDLISRAVEAINAEKNYKMIINASALVNADPSLDITTMVLNKVNELYAAEAKEAKK